MKDPEPDWTSSERWMARALVTTVGQSTAVCLQPETILGLIETGGDAPDADRLLGHVAECPHCRREYAELRAALNEADTLRQTTGSGMGAALEPVLPQSGRAAPESELRLRLLTPQKLSLAPLRRRLTPMLALAAAALLLCALLWRASIGRSDSTHPAAGQDLPTGVAEIAGLDPRLIQNLRTMLETGDVSWPPALAELNAIGVGRGGSPESRGIVPIQPVGTLVSSDRPTLTWRLPTSCRSCLIVITDAQRHQVAEDRISLSPGRSEFSWTPPKPLKPGRTYLWQATDQDNGASSPVAAFAVLSRNEVEAVSAASARLRNHPDLLGALYARYGLLDDARSALADSNTPQARALLAAVQHLRR
jgi:hypothetical protein